MEALGAAGGAAFRDGVEDAVRSGIEWASVAHRLGPCGGFLNGGAVRKIVVAESPPFGLGEAGRKRTHAGERQNAKRDETKRDGTTAHETPPSYPAGAKVLDAPAQHGIEHSKLHHERELVGEIPGFLPLAVDDEHHGDLRDLHAPAGWREPVKRLGMDADDLEPHPHPVALGHDIDDAIAPVRER